MKISENKGGNTEKDPSQNRIEAHNDEELVAMAWKAIDYASYGIKSLKELYPKLPSELEPHREFYRKLIEASTEFLVNTGNWYKKQE